MRTILRLVSALFALASIGLSIPARAIDFNQQIEFDIPAQPLPSALVLFSRQAGVQVLTATKELEGLQSSSLKGRYSLREGAETLLEVTGLTAGQGGVSAIAIKPKNGQAGGLPQNPTRLAQAESAGASEEASESRRS